MNILGIDYGEKYVGLAMADSDLKIAMPDQVIENKDKSFLFSKLKQIIKEQEIKKIVVGQPVGLKGEDTLQTKIINQFIDNLRKEIKILVISFDERLTTKMADKLLEGRSPNHAVAAQIILQDYLDYSSK